MKGKYYSEFISAIHNKKKVMITFYSKEDRGSLKRKCAPMDFAIGRRERSGIVKYWFWDYESDEGPHTLGLSANQIRDLKVLEESFEPSEFITWNTRKSQWAVKRDWGTYS